MTTKQTTALVCLLLAACTPDPHPILTGWYRVANGEGRQCLCSDQFRAVDTGMDTMRITAAPAGDKALIGKDFNSEPMLGNQ